MLRMNTRIPRSLRSTGRRPVLGFLLVFVLVGLVVLAATHAAKPLAGFEPESGTLSGGATKEAQSGASNDAVLKFGPGGNEMYTAKAIANPPSYPGSTSFGNQCNHTYATTGYEPQTAGGAKHPLFFYFIGSRLVDSDLSARYNAAASMAITKAMAERGFYALSVDYENSLSPTDIKMSCIYNSLQPQNLLAQACALPQVDCNMGIATWGHSQGAALAIRAHNYDSRARATWLTGFSGDSSATLAKNRIRLVNAEGDGMNNSQNTLNSVMGLSCSSGNSCNGANGSGWIRVTKADLATVNGVAPSADHCWFNQRSCSGTPNILEPNWLSGTAPFSLPVNADWLRTRTATP